MNPWFGKVMVLSGIVGTMIIRAPHGRRSREIKVIKNKKGKLEILLLALMSICMMGLPLLAFVTPLLAFADYPLHPVLFACAAAAMAAYLWLFYRSHADLGKNWSISLELRDGHRIVTSGVYRTIRHPMYAAIFLYSIAQALLLPNWVAGPSCLIAFTLTFVFRVNVEEKMMLENFGTEYEAYMNRTKRLLPGVY